MPEGFPVNTRGAVDMMVEEGRSVVLECPVNERSQHKIKWIKDHIPVNITDHRKTLLNSGGFIYYIIYIQLL